MSVFDKLKIDDYKDQDFIALMEKYRNFWAPSGSVLLEGEDARQLGVEIPDIQIFNALNDADQFSFSVSNAFDQVNRDFKWLDDYLAPGRTVEISLGYADKLEPVIFGRIMSVQVDFPAGGQPRLQVSGLDISQAMMAGKKSESWINVSDSDVVRMIAQKYKIPNLEISHSGIKKPQIEKQGLSDFAFINMLADNNNFKFFIFGKTLYFKEKTTRVSPVVTLEWGKNLISFTPEINIDGQPTKIRRIGWDSANKKKILGEASSVDEIGKGGSVSSVDLVRQIYGQDIVEEILTYVSSQEDADRLAQADLNERSSKLISGSGLCIGLPEIRAGRHIELAGLGRRFSRTYYLQSTIHSLNSSGYQTGFEVRSNKL